MDSRYSRACAAMPFHSLVVLFSRYCFQFFVNHIISRAFFCSLLCLLISDILVFKISDKRYLSS